ncbi:TetR/AcrR family transcriptional regulator [Paraburkholderia acidisoli]|uniref:TetR family transcriptional regulator n=1 Tax=Paraburkholderia acidisoli TaxID=2571748 RepID=A0A7Z2JJZ2_9BURK|nr:TetR/AcrR family transcriptional regulator [Paraburkholderia acidisoli]QGZ65885.1 TetR family transcriptional regulator [Paraburkholderia acidisoli]
MDSSTPTDPETACDTHREIDRDPQRESGHTPAPVARGRGRGRPVTVSREVRREQILSAAERLFSETGYADTSMADIARVCETSKRTLYELFPTKEDLFRSLVGNMETFAGLPHEIDAAASTHDALEAALDAIAHYVLDVRHVTLARLVIAESHRFPELRQRYYEQGVEHCKRWLEARIAALVACRRLAPVNENRLAGMLFGAVIGTPLIAAIADRRLPEMAEVAAHAREAVASFVATPR